MPYPSSVQGRTRKAFCVPRMEAQQICISDQRQIISVRSDTQGDAWMHASLSFVQRTYVYAYNTWSIIYYIVVRSSSASHCALQPLLRCTCPPGQTNEMGFIQKQSAEKRRKRSSGENKDGRASADYKAQTRRNAQRSSTSTVAAAALPFCCARDRSPLVHTACHWVGVLIIVLCPFVMQTALCTLRAPVFDWPVTPRPEWEAVPGAGCSLLSHYAASCCTPLIRARARGVPMIDCA